MSKETQIEKIKDRLYEVYPDFDYNISLDDKKNNLIVISWEGQYSQFDIFKEVGYLSSSFNTTAEENELYPCQSKYQVTLPNDEINALTEKLKQQIINNDEIAKRILNKSINGQLQSGDSIMLKMKVYNYKHLIDNDFSTLTHRVPTVENLINNYKMSKSESEVIELNKFLNDNNFIMAMNGVRLFYKDTYMTQGFEEFFNKVVERKSNAVEKILEDNVVEINKKVIANYIRRNNHKGKVEDIFGNLTMENLKSPLFGVSLNSRYEEQLEKTINLMFIDNNLTPIEQEIYKYSTRKKQTINDLKDFHLFVEKSFDENKYMQRDFSNNTSLVLTDDLIILIHDGKIATQQTKSVTDKFSITLKLVPS